ncbi:hypothetical protein A2962_03460 [Candidatus Woesebacteria bacterium RIFCSPLOWO2_01_FULL_39_61]|uniref:Transposase IS200-like domain-containing protein n=1 Tax=Candidatus Woesebacteria bacterium RIFCSPHIGHO2_02_FULL_39_13 TaxID=1802505 RepID=A0A1F7Z5B7_9BACT|nr:MAG: hypothetical protein A2692_00590 [Candidatus Woesebacteria bacterium RIFCSPHIGHO2_01_FULL_39_95]OGM34108.1 MAG: hypothetical protein A3D01_00045 [Candidatus Woesebacteria bacterium RIFCSPHIGHO2_02_FULL_39_13]OGM38707.1 MAG: hypothetical protein A3E13_03780 [Candidatus Woesebacteria bacterium RIFCSPHIGHO2_12_FULL_40_20]OGM67568.1 MAG: hypothetical protein A2962_03460 [Candidatus Woesebacteria bacterium RIFCSPLOWO2_01_FULL_39_61]OGM74268.1 MAG: hypothetical protein A3H19_01960 [Candidatus
MPQKNTVKISVENSFYHIYNRGVEKRIIFENEQDYRVFLHYLKEALSPPLKKEDLPKDKVHVQGVSFDRPKRQSKNLHNKIELIAYCLMSNHFHLLIKQVEKGSMETLMRSLLTRYSMYFNKKYKRVGTLFQGTYKASLIDNDRYLLHLTRYIHLNPIETTSDVSRWYSSYANYLGIKKSNWLNPKLILSFFERAKIPELKRVNSYEKFVEDFKKDSAEILGEHTLE